MSSHGHPEPPVTEHDRVARLVRGCVILLLAGVIVFSRTIAVPALAAVLLSIALFPLVNRLSRLDVPRAIASVSVLIALVAIAAGLVYAVHRPLAQLAARAPELMDAAHEMLARLSGQRVSVPVAQQKDQQAIADMVAPLAAGLGTSLLAVGTSLILCHFILTSGSGVGRATLSAIRGRHDRRSWLRVFGAIRTQAAYYLQLVALINVVFGIVTGLALTVLGVKDAAAFGLIAGLMNFIPLVGAMITTGVLLAGGLAEHGVSTAIILPAAVFLLLHIIESQFVTPQLLGRRLQLNPLIVIAGVLVGATAWGIGGAFLAVPILTSVKVALDAHPRHRRWGQVLGRGALVEVGIEEARRRRLRRSPRARAMASKSH